MLGPCRTQQNGYFKHYVTAHSVDDKTVVRVTLTGKGDPVRWTSLPLGEGTLIR